MDLTTLWGRRGRQLDREGREAAVLVPVVERPTGPSLVFTKRGDDLSDHAGQMSFPGGSREPADVDPFGTAIREANEEIGLRADEVARVGELDDIRTTTGFIVRPFVARIPDRAYTPDGIEVAEIAVLPVAAFLSRKRYERDRRGERVIHVFSVEGYRIWGATARLVVQLLELTTDWRADPVPE